jgi:hypothetical protein
VSIERLSLIQANRRHYPIGSTPSVSESDRGLLVAEARRDDGDEDGCDDRHSNGEAYRLCRASGRWQQREHCTRAVERCVKNECEEEVSVRPVVKPGEQDRQTNDLEQNSTWRSAGL